MNMGRGVGTAESGATVAVRGDQDNADSSQLELALRLAQEASATDPYLAGIDRQVEKLGRLHGQPKIGTNRIVFCAEENVIKVPYSQEGVLANGREAGWKNAGIPLAEAELFQLDPDDGVWLLRMERIDPLTGTARNEADLPDWVGFVDCGQVGYNRAGELVAYDL